MKYKSRLIYSERWATENNYALIIISNSAIFDSFSAVFEAFADAGMISKSNMGEIQNAAAENYHPSSWTDSAGNYKYTPRTARKHSVTWKGNKENFVC